MKLLYIDVFAEAINPTATLMPLLFRTVSAATVFYGPGFSSRAALEGGVERFIETAGPLDAVVFGPNIPLLSDVSDPVNATTRSLRNFTALSSDPSIVAPFLTDVLGAAGRIRERKFVSTLNFDCYACSPQQIERVEALGLYLIGPNLQSVARLADLPDYVRQERHFQRKSHRICDAYAEFVSAHPERVVTAVHFVAETEITLRHSDERAYEINVPGVEYVLRDRALQALSQAGVKTAPKRIFHLYRLLGRLGLKVFAHHLPLKIYHAAFMHGLVDSRLVYTARGGFGLPIRKFFEIPAAGAMMICTPPLGFRALGFLDGEHYVAAEPESLPSVVAGLQRHPEKIAEISRRGQNLVFAEHSLAARARQIGACLEAIVAGTYRGSDWQEGKFVLRTDRATSTADAADTRQPAAIGTGR